MKNILVAATLFALLCGHPPLAPADQLIPASCVQAVDGDTLRVRVAGILVDVRLLGIDAPEHDQEWGTEATAFAAAWCGPGRDIGLELDRQERDRYKRTLAYVWAGGEMLNLELVASGLAVACPYKPNLAHAAEIEAAQAESRAAKAGFWKQGGLRMSPSAWRKQARETK